MNKNSQISGISRQNARIRSGRSNSRILWIPRWLRKIYSLHYSECI